ncbi:MAG: SGNH/GDSL hydrolase family protein [Oscillospiraceae bacterium]
MPNNTPRGPQYPDNSYPENNGYGNQDFYDQNGLFDETPSSPDLFGEAPMGGDGPYYDDGYYDDANANADGGFDMFGGEAGFEPDPYDNYDAPRPSNARGMFGEEIPSSQDASPNLFEEDDPSYGEPDGGLYVGFADQEPPHNMPPKSAPQRKVYSAGKGSANGKGSSKKSASPSGAPGAPGGKGNSPAGRAASKRQKQKKMFIIAGSGIGALVLILLLAILLPPFLRGNSDSSLLTSSSLTVDSGVTGEFSIPVEQLQGTILGETEDAGAEYVTDTLFIGDSNTARMVSYRTDTGVTLDNGIGIVGMGITDVATAACVKFVGYSSQVSIPEAVKIMQPRRVVLTFGTNNVGGISVSSFTDSYKKATDAIQSAYPYADIIIAAIPPIAKQHAGNSSLSQSGIDEYNLALANLAEAEGYKFLNWTEVLKDSKTGYIKDGYVLGNDGIHLTRAAMTSMFTYFRTHAYVGEDTRPKPLNDVPKRSEVPSPYVSSGDPTGTESSSASGSESEVTEGVKISVFAYDDTNGKSGGGTIVYSGSEKASFSVTIKAGGTAGPFQAKAAAGYEFVGWGAPQDGRISAGSASTSIQLISSKTGDTVNLVAHFKKVATSSSATSTPPASSTTSTAPSSTAPPSSTQPPASSTEPPASSTEPTAPSSTEDTGEGGGG